MKVGRFVFLALALALAGSPALACSPPPGWPFKIVVPAKAAAERMVSAATYIDIAVVERLSDDFEFATLSRTQWLAYAKTDHQRKEAEENLAMLRESYADEAKRIHYRVIEHLKGASDETFSLSGIGVPDAGSRKLWKRVRLGDLKLFLDQEDLAASSGPGSCEMPPFGILGRRFLIFRDARGRILRTLVPIRFHGEAGEIAGPAIVPIAGDGDEWPALIRGTLKASR